MPQNRQIDSARDTLKYMINSLPEDSLIYKFILEKVKFNYDFKASYTTTTTSRKLVPNRAINWKELSPFLFHDEKGGTYMFYQTLTG